jgi:hypothetical protein
VGARVLVVIAAALLLAGCGSRQAAGSSGLSGRAILSPATPVCRTGTSCSKPARGLTLVFDRDGHTARTKTDKQGGFRIALAPGTYRLSVAGARPGSRLKPGMAKVEAGSYGNLELRYDAGIR